jgi:ABC-type branched-subunit amino acid transport system substrate-binding protein
VGFHHSGSQIAVGGGSVWVIDAAGSVERVDPTSRRPQVIPDDGYRASAVAFGDGAAWVLGERTGQAGPPEGPFVWRIDPQALHPSDRIRVQESGASDLAVGAGSVWVASPWDGLVARIHPGTQLRTQTIEASGATTVRFDEAGGTLWVADPLGHTLRRIDPATGRVGAPVELSGSPQGMTFAGGLAYASVINAGGGGLALRAVGVADVQRSGCQGVWGDPSRRPDLLIVGDFPLDQVGSRIDSEAVLSVLAQHGFRAGQHTVGYQVCDDRGNSATNPPEDCAKFAHAYAQTARVTAVITGSSSGCAQPQLPELLNAAGGAVAAIGTVSTDDALTDGSHLNYVRLVARNSDLVSAAIGVFAQHRASRVFLLSEDLGVYTGEVSDLFRRRATGPVTIVGAADYGSLTEAGIDRLVRQVRQAGASGVYLVGIPESTTGMLLKALRAVSPRVVIVAADSLNQVSAAISVAGDAARDIYLTSADPPHGALPPIGRQWLHRFAATQLGAQVPTSSALAAAAAQVLLNSIARSDGTRGSVVAHLRATNLPDSIIGPVRFTPRGDIAACSVSVYRIVGGTFSVADVQSDLQGAMFVQRTGCSPAAG